jgi:hypothetical protein
MGIFTIVYLIIFLIIIIGIPTSLFFGIKNIIKYFFEQKNKYK